MTEQCVGVVVVEERRTESDVKRAALHLLHLRACGACGLRATPSSLARRPSQRQIRWKWTLREAVAVHSGELAIYPPK